MRSLYDAMDDHPPTTAEDLLEAASRAVLDRDTLRAAQLFRRARERSVQEEDGWGAFCALVGLVGVADPAGDGDAISELDDLIHKLPGNSVLLAQAKLNLGLAHLRSGRPERAAARLAEAAAEADRAGDGRVRAAALNNLAVVLSRTDRAEAARSILREAAAAARAAGDEEAGGDGLRILAATFGRLGRPQEAVDAYEESVKAYRAAELHHDAAVATIGLAMALSTLGEHPRALKLLHAAEAAMGDDLEGRAQATNNLGNVERKLGNLDGALRAYERALAAWAALPGSELDQARAKLNIASVLHRMAHFGEASEILDEVAPTYAARGTEQQQATWQSNRSALLADWADSQPATAPPDALAEALRLAVEAAGICERERYRLQEAADRFGLAVTTFGQVYRNLIRVAVMVSQDDLAASAIESVRSHAVVGQETTGHTLERPLVVEPQPVMARAGTRTVSRAIGGVALSDLAVQLGGADDARWLGCAVLGRNAHVAVVDQERTDVSIRPFDPTILDHFQACLPVPATWEREAAARDPRVDLLRLVDWRVASGALGRDPARAELVSRSLPRTLLTQARGRPDVAAAAQASLDEVLWPFAEALLPPVLREELSARAGSGDRASLVIATDPATGRLPWALLPLRPPDQHKPTVRLIDAARVVHAPPAALCAALLARQPEPSGASGDGLWVRNPSGDMPKALEVALPPHTEALDGYAATTNALTSRLLAQPPGLLAFTGHVNSGRLGLPSSQGLVLASPDGSRSTEVLDARRVLAGSIPFPARVLLLGCDSLGGAALEWTGIAAAMMWNGAREVVATLWPVQERKELHRMDAELVKAVMTRGGPDGVDAELRRRLHVHRSYPADQRTPVLRWGGIAAIGWGRSVPADGG